MQERRKVLHTASPARGPLALSLALAAMTAPAPGLHAQFPTGSAPCCEIAWERWAAPNSLRARAPATEQQLWTGANRVSRSPVHRSIGPPEHVVEPQNAVQCISSISAAALNLKPPGISLAVLATERAQMDQCARSGVPCIGCPIGIDPRSSRDRVGWPPKWHIQHFRYPRIPHHEWPRRAAR
ncbi:hypothetical protein DFH27DRAFT_527222 [Peziza echinospora]|nr:hypothetical protein DFH27DRAFT_527222 [Peziza echinospora]